MSNPDAIQAQSFNHVAIWVRDMRKSADWYIKHLGLTEHSVSGDHIFLALGGGEVLALFETSDPQHIGAGVHHLALNVPPGRQKQALDSLRRANIPLKKRGPSLGFQDPDGYWIHFSD